MLTCEDCAAFNGLSAEQLAIIEKQTGYVGILAMAWAASQQGTPAVLIAEPANTPIPQTFKVRAPSRRRAAGFPQPPVETFAISP